jgi:hypothetical protein
MDRISRAYIGKNRVSIRRCESEVDKVNPDAYLSLVLTRTTNYKSCKEAIEKFGHFDCGFMNILCDPSLIPKRFVPITKASMVRELYNEYYETVERQEKESK